MKTFWIFLCVSLMPLAALAKSHRHHHHYTAVRPRDLVERYLSADFHGSRILHEANAATSKNVTWTEEPPWDQVIVVAHYQVGRQRTRRHMSKVAVKFENLGELKGDIFYPDTHVEDVTFGVVRSLGTWRIDRPILVPHVSVAAAEKFLNSELAQAQPKSDKAKALQKAINDLQNKQAK